MKLLLDTDIGSDIDDAVCLAYLLLQTNAELLGITTVSGQSTKRAMIASAICRAAQKDHIPIFPGAESPLIVKQRQPYVPLARKLDNWPHVIEYPVIGEAIPFLRRTIRNYPNEITLLAIGPLTNIALLFMSDPEIPNLLDGLVIMGGAYSSSDNLEWNIMLDPHAAAIVYRTPVEVHRSIGLDVTTKVTMPKDAVKKQFDTPLLKTVYNFAGVWFERKDRITFHDPLAATTIFDETICQFEIGTVNIKLPEGKTHWQQSKLGHHEIATNVNTLRFFEHFFSTVGEK